MPQKQPSKLTDLSVIPVDIGKDTFHVVDVNPAGERVLRLKIKRLALPQVFEDLPRCIVGMEACLSAHLVRRTCAGSVSSREACRRSISSRSAKARVGGQENDPLSRFPAERLQSCGGDR